MLKKLSYIGAFIILLFFVGFGLWRKQVQKVALANDQRVNVTIQNVNCTADKEQSSLSFLDKENKINQVPINYQNCYQYKKGDTLTLLYNEKRNQYHIDSEQN